MSGEQPLFKNIEEEELLALESLAKEVPLSAGEFLFHAGESRNYMYIILEGKIKVFDPSESEESVGIIEQGQPLSEEALMDSPGVHSKSAQAMLRSKVLVLPSSSFKGFMAQHPHGAAQLLKNMAEMLASRLKSTNRRIIAIYRVGKILSDPDLRKNLKSLSEKILSVILTVIKASKAIIAINNSLDHKMEATAFYGFPGEEVGKILKTLNDSKEFNEILSERKTIFINGAKELEAARLGFLAKSSLIVSPMTNEDTFGAIILSDKKDPLGFSVRNEVLLSIITKEVTLALAEARLRKEKEAEQELKRVYIEGL